MITGRSFFLPFFQHQRSVLSHLGVKMPEIAVREILQIKFPIQLGTAYFPEFQIIREGHDNIDIVIPRDKSLMPDRAEQRAGIQLIGDMVFAADPVDFQQDLQLGQLQFS